MLRFALIFLPFLAFSCSGEPTKRNNPEQRYVSDATDCYQAVERKQQLKVPIAGAKGVILSVTTIEIPLGSDAGAFRLCMKHKGHPVNASKANPDDYLNVSRTCMQEARDSLSPNESYANCVQRSKITVETIAPDKL
ncbi:hypothetical protein [Methyloglobulus sp.]|uniref:hypothetical protein n=1 Tax=Methyloglobulus sp. TaxID=2518622 RepID=UPI0032B6FB29